MSRFLQDEHPDHPGWREWRVPGEDKFNQAVIGLLLVRKDHGTSARVRMFPTQQHLNAGDVIHGGVILSLIDVAMFAGAGVLGKGIERGVTVEANAHFLAPGNPDLPLDAVVEVVRETGRMVFSRGLVVQGEASVASFSGILRKISKRR